MMRLKCLKEILAVNLKDVSKSYFDWINSINLLNSYEEYYKAIDDKLNELMVNNRGEGD